MTSITFEIPGKPFAWRRARSNGRIRFKDAATEQHEATIQAIALQHFPKPLEGPLRVLMAAYFAMPSSWSAKKRAAHLGRPYAQKPDADNLIKMIGDSLNRIAWVDDSQIAEIGVGKLWAVRAYTVVTVETL